MSGTGMMRRGTGETTMRKSWRQRVASALYGMLLGAVIPTLALGQSATLLPNAKQQYIDDSGMPVASGQVFYYIPTTFTKKNVWLDANKGTLSTNPVILDIAGRPQPTGQTFGDGQYRQVVKDVNGVTIWDALTQSTNGGSSGGGGTATGDGDLVGTIKPWAGLAAPNQYMFAYGQAISRTTYSALFTAITQVQSVICTSGLNVLSGLSDTTQIPIGGKVEATCIAPGATVTAKSTTSVTLSVNASVSTAVSATFFLYGNGNGSTTFNLPDIRGRVLPGRDNMGGTASGTLLSTYYGTNPDATGALGGNQSVLVAASNLPTAASVNFNAISLSVVSTLNSVVSNTAGIASSNAAGGANGQLNSNTGIISSVTSTGSVAAGSVTSITRDSSGAALGALVAAAGSGYTNGSQIITVVGGLCSIQPQFTVTVSGNAFTGTPALLTAGSCIAAPANPASTTGGGGTGGTLLVTYGGTSISVVQPSITINYIIKVTPDANSSTASGVTSLGGMTGDIACGSGLLCTGNIISVSAALYAASPPVSLSGNTFSLSYWYNGNVAVVENPLYAGGAVGDGTADDAPAFRAAALAVHNAGGGIVQMSCNRTYLMKTRDPDGANATSTIVQPYSNVAWIGCNDSSTVKIDAGLNTLTTSYTVFYPLVLTNAATYTNIGYYNFKLDMNGANNAGFNNNNIGIGANYVTGATVRNVTFANNPGSWYVQFGDVSAATSSARIFINGNRFGDACDIVNASCLDHSSIYLAAAGCDADGNIFNQSSASTRTTAVEIHGSNCHANNNTINNYALGANIAAESGLSIKASAFNNNTMQNARFGAWLWALNSQTLTGVSICNNTFYRTVEPAGGGVGFIDAGFSQGGSAHFTNGNSDTVKICNNQIYSSAALGTAATEPVIVVGQIKNLDVSGNLITNANAPCIGNNGNAFTVGSSFTLKDNTCIDTGRTSTAGSQRGFLFSTATTIDSLTVSGNRIKNSTLLTTGIDMTISSTYGVIANDNLVSNVTTVSSITGSGFQVAVANSVPCSAAIGYPFSGTNAFTSGQVLTGQASGCPQPKTVGGACTMSATGVLTCSINAIMTMGTGAVCAAIPQATTSFFGTMGCQSTTEANWQTPIAIAFSARNLQVKATSTPAGGQTYAITLRQNGADTTLTCTISNPATTCSDVTHAVAIAAGDLVNIKIVASATSGSVNAVNASILTLTTQ